MAKEFTATVGPISRVMSTCAHFKLMKSGTHLTMPFAGPFNCKGIPAALQADMRKWLAEKAGKVATDRVSIAFCTELSATPATGAARMVLGLGFCQGALICVLRKPLPCFCLLSSRLPSPHGTGLTSKPCHWFASHHRDTGRCLSPLQQAVRAKYGCMGHRAYRPVQ